MADSQATTPTDTKPVTSDEGYITAVVTPGNRAAEKSTCRTQRLINDLHRELEDQNSEINNPSPHYGNLFNVGYPIHAGPDHVSQLRVETGPYLTEQDTEVIFTKTYSGPPAIFDSHYENSYGTLPDRYGVSHFNPTNALLPSLDQSIGQRYGSLGVRERMMSNGPYGAARGHLMDIQEQLKTLREKMNHFDEAMYQKPTA